MVLWAGKKGRRVAAWRKTVGEGGRLTVTGEELLAGALELEAVVVVIIAS